MEEDVGGMWRDCVGGDRLTTRDSPQQAVMQWGAAGLAAYDAV